MLLATRCPFCETVFRIQPAQLAARRGLVRCGHCQEAFDATGSLYEMPEGGDFALATPVAADIAASLTTPGAAAAATHVTHAAQPIHTESVVETLSETEPDVAQQPDSGPTPEQVSEHESGHASEPEPGQQPAAPGHASEAAPESFAQIHEAVVEPESAPEPEPEPEPAPARPAPPPNFAGAAWDPWAPLPDSHLDPSLQYNADHLPQASLAAAATSKPARDAVMRVIHDDEPTFASESAVAQATPETPAEPFPPATRWTRVEPELIPPEPIAPGSAHPGPAEPTLSSGEIAHNAPRTPSADPEPALRRSTAVTAAPAAGVAAVATPATTPAATAAPAFTALDPNGGDDPFAVTRETPARAKGHPGWRIVGSLLALALVVLLALQLVWWQRESVMVYWPASQPIYQQVCAQLGCHVSPPRDIDGLQVQPSDLRQVDDPHHLELKVPLRNRFQVALAYPAIELTLLDRQNNVVLRRVLWPQDYAPPGTRIDAGLPAHTTQTMIVRLDTGNVIASNFRIEIFYP
ncbi:zinc-ribbon and DUF3426 domain-containing protein [Burkholderia sp. Ax-1719]|uniref:zinc-ribbon and DUF3426 domain-containing protein n=1 Tax=Burkholderia sp. Ax-1719 TaxID=2608334 RepID=UPI00141F87C8|nr:zinc-ribbon and DUF3426 domain-containing protein [Burkholderia sp. Ax-1719]NIE68589.1 DUF3426 domain-containing protein [Burkholderia sp. Ax-1719]